MLVHQPLELRDGRFVDIDAADGRRAPAAAPVREPDGSRKRRCRQQQHQHDENRNRPSGQSGHRTNLHTAGACADHSGASGQAGKSSRFRAAALAARVPLPSGGARRPTDPGWAPPAGESHRANPNEPITTVRSGSTRRSVRARRGLRRRFRASSSCRSRLSGHPHPGCTRHCAGRCRSCGRPVLRCAFRTTA